MAKKKKLRIPYWITIAIAAILFVGGDKLKSVIGLEDVSERMEQLSGKADMSRMEIPVTTEGRKRQILQRTGYTLSYDTQYKTPQWVAWELTKAETRGEAERCKEFYPDPDVIGTQVVTYDYSNTGYDRGHMAPAGDMKWNKKAMQESFYMSNICPQNHNLNTEDWNDLEMKTREWARRYGKVYVVCGPIYQGQPKKYIGEHRIAVPDAFFKVILINENNKQCALGFLFDNESGERPLKEYRVSVDSIEKMTGLDFFSALPDNLENRLEKDISEKLP